MDWTDLAQGRDKWQAVQNKQVLKSYQSNRTVLLIVQIYINLGLHVSTLVKSSSGPLRYRSKTRSSSALWDPQRLHISYTHTYIYIYIYTHTHTHTHTYIYTYIYVYIFVYV